VTVGIASDGGYSPFPALPGVPSGTSTIPLGSARVDCAVEPVVVSLVFGLRNKTPQTDSTNSSRSPFFSSRFANFRGRIEGQHFFLDYRQSDRTYADVRGLEEASFP